MNPPILPPDELHQENVQEPEPEKLIEPTVEQQPEQKVETPKKVVPEVKTEPKDVEKKPQKIKFGFVTKQGEVRKNWTLRYFILYDDGELEYYKDAVKGKNPNDYADMRKASFKGAINVATCRFRIAKGIKKGDLVLEVELKDRFFYMAFDTKEDMSDWKVELESTGAEFFDIIVPQQKSFYERKLQEMNKQKNVIKRGENSKGRAIEEIGSRKTSGSIFFGLGSHKTNTSTPGTPTPGSPQVGVQEKVEIKPQYTFSFFGRSDIDKESNSDLYQGIVEICQYAAQFKVIVTTGGYGTFCEACVEGGTQEYIQGYVCPTLYKDLVPVTKKNQDFSTIVGRQNAMLTKDVLVFYPGALDTASELMTAWMNMKSGISKSKIVVFEFWVPFIEDIKKNLSLDEQEDSGFTYVRSSSDLKQFFNQ